MAKTEESTIQTGHRPRYRYQYAVKFICYGVQDSPKDLVPGHYQTSVNIHNPHEVAVNYSSKMASPRNISDWQPVRTLKDDAVANISCADVPKYKLPPSAGFEGFLVIESTMELDVVAVYSAAPINGNEVSTMDVERVPGRRING